MKFSSVFSIFIAAATASAFSVDIPYGQKPVGSFNEDIPGNSPVQLCSKDPKADTVLITKVDINPNPPLPGESLHIEASGKVLEKIEEGAYIFVTVKVGYIQLLKKTFDFCEQIKEVNMTCPVEEGNVTVTKDVELPKQ